VQKVLAHTPTLGAIRRKMTNFHIISSNTFDLNSFESVENFVNSYPNFQTLVLKDEDELEILLKLIGIEKVKSKKLNEIYCKYWDLSDFNLPDYNEQAFGLLYQNWLKKTGRENSMNEYGNLIFLQNLNTKLNKSNYILIVKENNEI
jgi:hypothetical protein